METGAYIAAVSVPEVVFTIVGLAISTTFIPMLSEIKSKQGKKKMFEFSNNIITIISYNMYLSISFRISIYKANSRFNFL